MARIRTVKPEFPQSESMGRVSRDARLLFVQLWTYCDDEGRARGHSRMLASALFPYDEDAPTLLDGWIAELEREGCVRRYEVEGATYIQVLNWQKHQKIDKPSPSKLPPFAEGSRKVAKPREHSVPDLVPSTVVPGPSTGIKTQASPVTAVPSLGMPLDFKKLVFTSGLAYLVASGLRERDARSMLGKWRRDSGDAAILMALASADGAAVSEPIPYIQAILSKANGNGSSGKSGQFGAADHHLGQFGALIEKYKLEEGDEGSNCH